MRFCPLYALSIAVCEVDGLRKLSTHLGQYDVARRANHASSRVSCPALSRKIFRFVEHPNQTYNCRRLIPHEGRIAIVTDVGMGCGGRTSPSAMIARRTAFGGEVVWSWRSNAGAKVAESSANDGGNQAWSPRRARRTPLKPLRRECRLMRCTLGC